MIKSYFSETDHSYRIHYVNEDKPLGTAGSLSLIEEIFDKPLIITNCDILIEEDYSHIINYHKQSRNDITIVSAIKNTIIPYGVLHSKEAGIVTSMEEKPHLSFLVNTGMYILEPQYMEWIPRNTVFHMTDLVDIMLKRNRKVGTFPISEKSFLDMGQIEELRKMEERIGPGAVR